VETQSNNAMRRPLALPERTITIITIIIIISLEELKRVRQARAQSLRRQHVKPIACELRPLPRANP
jgi:hypothetical protein